MSPRGSRTVRLWAIASLMFATWLATAYSLVPWLIGGAYHGESLALFNQVISGQGIHPLTDYLALWNSLAWKLTLGLALALVAMVFALRFKLRIQTHFDRLLGQSARLLRVRDVVLLWVWAGLLTGIAEAIIAGVTFSIKRAPNSWYAFEVVWMAPIVAASLFLATGGVIVLASLGWRSLRSSGVTIFTLSALGCYIVLRILPIGLFPWAAVLLSLGLAVTFVRAVATHSPHFLLFVRRSSVLMIAIIGVIGVGFPLLKRLDEHRAMSQLGMARPGLPNVLLIILDTVRAQSLSLYGYERDTSPHLASLAETGAVFDRAVAPSSWTLPSHASMFTGRYPFELSADWEVALNEDFPTLAEVLTKKGYATAGFVANYFYTKQSTGLSRGFIHYDAEKMSVELVLRNSWAANRIIRTIKKLLDIHRSIARKTAGEVNAEFLQWLPTADGKPFFVFLNYFGAHDPYRPPEPFNSKFGTGTQQFWLDNATPPEFSSAELADLVDAYDGAIAYVDDQVGRLLQALDKSGTLQNTLVIISADHGEQFGERSPDLVNHGNSLYLSSLHVPLVIWYPPTVPGGQRFRDPVTLRDIPATIADMLAISPDSPFPGESLTRFWNESSSPGRESSPLLSEVGPHDHIQPWEPAHAGRMWSLLSDTLHYIRNGDDREELYDVATDPWERQDISQTQEGRRALPSFRMCLQEILNERALKDGPSSRDSDQPCVVRNIHALSSR